MLPAVRRFRRRRDPNSLVYGATSGLSAWALYRGQFRYMADHGWHVTVVADGDDDLARSGVREGVPTHPVAMEREISPWRDVRSLGSWLAFLAKERPSVLNVGTPKAALLGLIAGRITGVPRRIYLVHGLRFEGSEGLQRAVLLAMERLTVWCATDVVVVSRSVGHVMMQNGLGARPLLVIGEGSCNGMDVPEIERRAREGAVPVREELGIPPENLLLVFVGRLVPDKGAAMLNGALRELTRRDVPVTVVVVGEAESEVGQQAWSEMSTSVRMVGWQDDPIGYIAASDVLVLPTRREGYPTVVLEANACRVPVVTTRATGAVDSVDDGRTGLLVGVDDAIGLADALQRLYDEPELRQALADRAYDRVSREFVPRDIWEGLDSIYRGTPTMHVAEVKA